MRVVTCNVLCYGLKLSDTAIFGILIIKKIRDLKPVKRLHIHDKSTLNQLIKEFWAKSPASHQPCRNCGAYSPGLRKVGHLQLFLKAIPEKHKRSNDLKGIFLREYNSTNGSKKNRKKTKKKKLVKAASPDSDTTSPGESPPPSPRPPTKWNLKEQEEKHKTNKSKKLTLNQELLKSEYIEEKSVNLILKRGQISLHDVYMVHGSEEKKS